MLTDEKLAEIEARANAATPGPWHACEDGVLFGTSADDSGVWQREDAAFIAHARSDIPALCEEVRRLRALLGEARECVLSIVEEFVSPKDDALLARIDAALRGES